MKCFIDNRFSKRSLLRIIPNKAHKVTPSNIVLVIDVSGSMNQEAQVTNDDGDKVSHGWSLLDIVKHATSTICGVLDENDSISIITFTNFAQCILDWTQCSQENKTMILHKLREMKPMSSTNYVAGLTQGFEQYHKKEFDSSQSYHIYFFTDGMPSSNFNPVRGYPHFVRDLQRKLIAAKNIKVNMSTIGLGNQLDSQLLSDMAPFGFIYMPDPGSIGPCMCNLIAHTKSISTFETLALSSVKISIFPASALRNVDCIFPVEVTDSNANVYIGSLNYDLPRNIVLDLDKYEKIELVQDQSILETFQEAQINDYEFHMIRTDVVRIMSAMHVPISTTLLQEEVAKLSSQNPLAITMNTQMIPGVTDSYYTWGKHFLKALPPMLRDERRSNFRDECLQMYCKNEHGSEDTLFEAMSNKAEQIFATTVPPEPSLLQQQSIYRAAPPPQRTQLPDEFLRGGGCWKHDCKVVVKMNNSTVEMKTSEVKAGYMVYNGKSFSKIVCVVKRNMKKIQIAQIGSLFVTPWHPILFEQDWKFPNDCTPVLLNEDSVTVYDLVLADTHIVVVENIPCITLGHNYATGILKHNYYGTSAIINDLKSCAGWSSGLIEFSDVEI